MSDRAYPVTKTMLIFTSAAIMSELADIIYNDDAEISARINDLATCRRQWGEALQKKPVNFDIDIVGLGEFTMQKLYTTHDTISYATEILTILDKLISPNLSTPAQNGIKCTSDEILKLIKKIDENKKLRSLSCPRRCVRCGCIMERPENECPECGAPENYHSPLGA